MTTDSFPYRLGIKAAVDEFFAGTAEVVGLPTGQAVVIRGPR